MRYKIVEGSQSGHCCFEATVVDTRKPLSDNRRYTSVCECFDPEDAKMICEALNKLSVDK